MESLHQQSDRKSRSLKSQNWSIIPWISTGITRRWIWCTEPFTNTPATSQTHHSLQEQPEPTLPMDVSSSTQHSCPPGEAQTHPGLPSWDTPQPPHQRKGFEMGFFGFGFCFMQAKFTGAECRVAGKAKTKQITRKTQVGHQLRAAAAFPAMEGSSHCGRSKPGWEQAAGQGGAQGKLRKPRWCSAPTAHAAAGVPCPPRCAGAGLGASPSGSCAPGSPRPSPQLQTWRVQNAGQ